MAAMGALLQEQAEHAGEEALLVRANAGRERHVQAECQLLGGTWVRAVEAHLDSSSRCCGSV